MMMIMPKALNDIEYVKVRKTITDQMIAPAPIIILFYTSESGQNFTIVIKNLKMQPKASFFDPAMSIMEGKRDVLAECKAKLETTLKVLTSTLCLESQG